MGKYFNISFSKNKLNIFLKGYGGYCYIPYGYLADERLYNFTDKLWTITSIVPRGNRLPSVRYLVVPPLQHQNAHAHQHQHQHHHHHQRRHH